MKQIVVLLAAGALLAGCTISQQQIDMHAPALNSWVGAPIDEFVAMQGTPTTVIDRVSYQIFKFDARKSQNVYHSGERCEPTTSHLESKRHQTHHKPWYTVTFACTYGLVVVENVIWDWSMDGNNCKMITVNFRPG